MLKLKNKIYCSVLIGVILLLPSVSNAALIFGEAQNQTINTNDTFIVKILLNTENETINAAEGSIKVSGAAQISDISLGQSEFSLWPKSPTITSSTGSSIISFTGGVPGGFNKTNGLLFSIVLLATKTGQVTIEPTAVTAYKNDGKGTPVKASINTLTVNITANGSSLNNEWKNLIALDKTPPESFSINLGQDPSVYGGKKFISFNTTDSGSGIDYFEVSEGSNNSLKTTSPYILKDQSAQNPITVKAYDKAGNVRTEVWHPTPPAKGLNLAVVLWIIIFSAIIIIILLFSKRKKNNS